MRNEKTYHIKSSELD